MNVLEDAYVGAVTAITYSPDSKYIVYGEYVTAEAGRNRIGSGKSITIYDNQQFQRIATVPALKSATIHGIRFCTDFPL